MQWRLFPAQNFRIRWLTAEQIAALKKAAIELESNDNGVFFGTGDLSKVLSVLKADVVATFPSPFKRIDDAVLRFTRADSDAANHFSVQFDTELKPNDPRLSMLPLVRQHLLPAVKRNTIIHLSVGIAREPVNDGQFHVFIDSAPRATQPARIPETLWGIPTSAPRGHAAFTVSGGGLAIVDSDQGFALGELVGNCLYVHFDVLGTKPSDCGKAIFLKVLAAAADEFDADASLKGALQELGAADDAELAGFTVRLDRPLKRLDRQKLQVMRHILVPTVRKNIVVHTGGGAQKPISDNQFHLFLYATPATAHGVNTPEKVFNVPVADRRTSWPLSDQGIAVTDRPSGFVAAEIVGGNCLYVHFGTGSGDSTTQLALLAQVLRESLKEIDVRTVVQDVLHELPEAVVASPRTDADFNVTVSGFGERPGQLIKGIAKAVLAPYVGTAVSVAHLKGGNQQPINDGQFHIFFQSSPVGGMNVNAPGKVFGLPVPASQKAFYPSGCGIAIADDAGYVVAELVENNLYIHQQLIYLGTRIEATILGRLFQTVRKELASNDAADRQEELLSAFEGECLNQVQAHQASQALSPDEVRKAEQWLEESVQRTIEAGRSLLRLQRADHFGPEYDELLAIGKVRDVRVDQDWIIVSTDVLYCVDPRTGITHEIGSFDIKIPTKGGDVLWINKDRKVDRGGGNYMCAPHVADTGKACYGNTKDLFPQWIRERQFATVVNAAILFAESVNTDDSWGKHINKWPVARGN